ncbi:MAG TPA: TIM barrel protein [Bryobacteraceae bacterium]|jgi:sugar phosphate isomerase/epimerase
MILNRRDFGKIALASIPVASTAMAATKINSTIAGVKIGAQSYCFRTMPLDEAVKAFVDCQIGECELTSMHVEPALGAPAPPAGRGPHPEAREALKKWRLSVPLDGFKKVHKKFEDVGVNVHAYNLSFREDFSDEEIDRGFLMAKAVGAKFITASSTIAAAKRVAPFADKHKMIVSMHGHSNKKNPNEFATPESFKEAMGMSKYFKINLDIGHFFAAGFDPVAYIKEHHADITNVHLKDRKKDDGPNVPWGEGDTPIKPVLLLLRDLKYPGYANIEYEYKGAADPVTEVKKCYQYIKDALA